MVCFVGGVLVSFCLLSVEFIYLASVAGKCFHFVEVCCSVFCWMWLIGVCSAGSCLIEEGSGLLR